MHLPKGEKKKNLLKLFPSSTDLQVHSDTYNYLLSHHPSPPSPPQTASFPKTPSLFFYKQRSYTYFEGRDGAGFDLKGQTLSVTCLNPWNQA